MSASPLPLDLTPVILQGHVLDVLRSLPEGSVQCVVTSPPYWGLRAYGTAPQEWGGGPTHAHEWAPTAPRRERNEADATSAIERASVGGRNYEAQGGELCGRCGAWRGELGLEPTPELYVEHLADVFDGVRRVLREDGVLWLNLGDTYVGGGRAGTNPEYQERHAEFGKVSGRDYAFTPPSRAPGLASKNLVGIPWRVAFELQRRGWWLRAENIWAKPNPMPESVTDRPTRAHEQVFLLTKSARYFYDADAVRKPLMPSTEARAKNHYSNPTDNPEPDSKWGKNEWRSYPVIGRRFAPSTIREIEQGYGGKATKDYSAASAQDPSAVKARIIEGARKRAEAGGELYANLKSVWWIATQPYAEAHFATFPEALAETCLRAGTSEHGACATCGAPWERQRESETRFAGGSGAAGRSAEDANASGKWASAEPGAQRGKNIKLGPVVTVRTLGFAPTCSCPPADPVPCVVLDPFSGSGTVAAKGRQLGLRTVGIELKPEYVALARRRSAADTPSLERFDGAESGPMVTQPPRPEPADPVGAGATNKQDALGKRTYTGFNERWRAKVAAERESVAPGEVSAK